MTRKAQMPTFFAEGKHGNSLMILLVLLGRLLLQALLHDRRILTSFEVDTRCDMLQCIPTA